MKKLFEIITTFLCFNSVTPVLMYYIYDDNPTIGFVGVDNVVGEYVTGYTAPKKSFTPSYGSRFQKFTNERVVDSHFKLMKSPSRYGHPTLMDRNAAQRRTDHRMTAPPQGWQSSNKQMITSNRQVQMPQQNQQLQQQQHPQQQQQQHPQQQQQQHPQQQQLQQQQQMHNSMQQQQKMQQQLPQQQQHQRQIQQQQQHQPQQRQVIPQANNLPRAFPNKASKQSHTVDSKRIDSQHHKDLSKKDNNIPPVRPKAVNADYTSPIKQRPRSSNSVYEPKPSFVQMNVRKTQILQDPQKLVRLNNNIQLKAASVLGSQNERQRIPTSMIMDKTLHKSNGLTDRNSQAMSQVLNDITQQVSERRHNKRENRVLDSKISFDNYGKEKHNYVSDNIKKFISNKTDKKHTNNVEIGNVESHEENLERKETPYALFYRMNPESLDQQEAFVFMRSVDPKSTQNVKSTKKQHISDFSLRETLNRRSNNHGKRLQKMKLLNNSGTRK